MKACVLHNEYESKHPSGGTEAVLRENRLLRDEGYRKFSFKKK